jgi:hypothetical protein
MRTPSLPRKRCATMAHDYPHTIPDGITPLIPQNPLEHALVAAKAGKVSSALFLATLLRSDVAVSSVEEIDAEGRGLRPLIFRKLGREFVAAFTDLGRARRFGHVAPFALTINARALLTGLAMGLGLVLNPEFTEGLDISPEGVQRILRDFRDPEDGT